MKAFKKELVMLGVLIVLAGITAALTPKTFLNPENLSNDVRRIALMVLYSLGGAMVIIAGGIDLSIGSVVCLTACLTPYLTTVHGMGIAPAVTLVLLLAIVIGALQGSVIARVGVQPFVVTLGSMLFLRGIAELITHGTEVGFLGKFPGFRFLGEGQGLGLPMPFWFALAAVAGTAFLMHRTIFGRFGYAIGANAEAARLSGVPVANIQTLTYVISAFLAGVAGVLLSAYLPAVSPITTGNSYELYAVVSAVLGGCSLSGGRGSVIGVVAGAGVMVVTLNAVSHLFNPLWENVALGAVILIAVIVDSVLEMKK